MGISSDGDTRLLSTMKHFTKFCISGRSEDDVLFSDDYQPEFICIQDTIHIGTKGRNRLGKPSVLIVMGNKVASVSHVKILINEVEKDIHGICMKDLCPDDKQNFKSLEKIMDPKVLKVLSENVIESEATVMYYKLFSEVTSSFIAINLSPLERIYKIWHATYFFRIWRNWLDSKTRYTPKDNFISSNTYECIEINAHNLVILVRKFREQKCEEFFLPFLFASQPCEETFRQLRSMGTINFTRINFTMLEVLHMIGRVELQNDIVHSKLANLNISFPRNKINRCGINFQLPNDEDIKTTMSNARENAIKDSKAFGIEMNQYDDIYCGIDEALSAYAKNKKRKIEEVYVDGNIREYSNEENIDCMSRFVEIESQPGKTKKIKKSKLVWILSDPKNSLSNDRLRRVQGSTQTTSCKRRLKFTKKITQKKWDKMNEIQIGDFCIFRNNHTEIDHQNSGLIFGAVIGFKYIKGNSEKHKQYTWDFAPVQSDLPEEERRGINVSASWHRFDLNGNLKPFDNVNCFHVDIENYVATLFNVSFEKTISGLSLNKDYLQSIQEELSAIL